MHANGVNIFPSFCVLSLCFIPKALFCFLANHESVVLLSSFPGLWLSERDGRPGGQTRSLPYTFVQYKGGGLLLAVSRVSAAAAAASGFEKRGLEGKKKYVGRRERRRRTSKK